MTRWVRKTTLAYDDLGRLTDATRTRSVAGTCRRSLARLVSTHTEYDGGTT
ncbi:MAG: hypothetical protein IPG17_10450 [Sandaracinaceae bacterium]|nr:hypothetical protein [Sandaracinaceae bacterium]